jgi:hypothetical protein
MLAHGGGKTQKPPDGSTCPYSDKITDSPLCAGVSNNKSSRRLHQVPPPPDLRQDMFIVRGFSPRPVVDC